MKSSKKSDEEMLDLIVIVPAYNEEGTIGSTISSLQEQSKEFLEKGICFKVYVVNDGSNDKTREIAANSGADRVVTHKINRGLGAAVRSGLEAAHEDGADIVVKFDADLQHDPLDIYKLILPILNDEAEIVYGHRFNDIEYKMPFIRRTGNLVFSRMMRYLTGWPLKDSQPGIFAVAREYVENCYMPGNYNYTQQILLDAYHKGMRFKHVDVSFRKRGGGKSFISLKYPFKVLPQILMVIIGVKPLKVFAPVGLFFLMLASLLSLYEVTLWGLNESPKPIEHVNLILGTAFFGLQTLFFGLLAHLVVELDKRRNGA